MGRASGNRGQCFTFYRFLLLGEGGTSGKDFVWGFGEGEVPCTWLGLLFLTTDAPSLAVCVLGITKAPSSVAPLVARGANVSVKLFCLACRSPQVGFLRFLDLLATFDWKNNPLIVNLNAGLTGE